MTEQEQVQLLPCEHCSLDAAIEYHCGVYYGQCSNDETCGHQGPMAWNEAEAIAAWNTRHRIEATAEALEAMREAQEALEYCKVEAYCSVDAECGSVDRYGYGRIETNAREALTRLTAAIAKIEGDMK